MSNCANCGIEIPEGQAVLLQGNKKNAPYVTICSNCRDAVEQAFRAETEGPNLLGAGLSGLGAAAIASLIWYGIVAITEYELGIIAIAIGWLVGLAIMWGAGRKRGRWLQLLSVGITLLAMMFSEYLVVRYFIVEMLKEEGYTGFQLFLPLGDMVMVIIEGIKANPLTLLFWAIALWEAWKVPGERKLRLA